MKDFQVEDNDPAILKAKSLNACGERERERERKERRKRHEVNKKKKIKDLHELRCFVFLPSVVALCKFPSDNIGPDGRVILHLMNNTPYFN